MTTYFVDGTFQFPSATLSGTVDITDGVLTSMDLAVPILPQHFTQIYTSQPGHGGWQLVGLTPGSTPFSGDSITITFYPVAHATSLIDFQQAQITAGAAFNVTGGFFSYYGASLNGTICPADGCLLPFPPIPPGVPAPVAGTGLIGLLVIVVLLLLARRQAAKEAMAALVAGRAA